MPAFVRDQGGPLTPAQVKALAEGIKPQWRAAPPSKDPVPPYSAGEGPANGNKGRGVRVFVRACGGPLFSRRYPGVRMPLACRGRGRAVILMVPARVARPRPDRGPLLLSAAACVGNPERRLTVLELLSTDYIERAAVHCIQMNPRRDGKRTALRFRAARRAGYGVWPEMARRCLERCDAEGIRGTVRVLRVLSDTKLVQTQGPVWIMSGQTV